MSASLPTAGLAPAARLPQPNTGRTEPVAEEAKGIFGPSVFCPIRLLCRDESQPRKTFPEEEEKQLTATIIAHGILEPILARRGEGELLLIMAGERRWRAALRAELTEVPVRIALRPLTPADILELQLVENTTQQAMPTLELAESLHRLQLLRPRPLSELATVTGLHISTVSRLLSLLRLPESIRAMIDKELVPAVAGEIAKLKDDRDKLDMAEKAALDRLTRDQVAVLVARRNAEAQAPVAAPCKPVRRLALHIQEAALDLTISGPDSQELSLKTILDALEIAQKQVRKQFQSGGQLADLAACFKKPKSRKKMAAAGNGHSPPVPTNT